MKRQRRPRGMRLCGLSAKECDAALDFDDAHIPCVMRADVLHQVRQTRAGALREGERKGLLKGSRLVKRMILDRELYGPWPKIGSIMDRLRAEAEKLGGKPWSPPPEPPEPSCGRCEYEESDGMLVKRCVSCETRAKRTRKR